MENDKQKELSGTRQAGDAGESTGQPANREQSDNTPQASLPAKEFPVPRPRKLCGMPFMDSDVFEEYLVELREWEAQKKAWEEQHGVPDRQD